ncbi:MAG: hypothetical protein MSC31_15150 [Solirubrobacteraceae bacterium MAG38_C4-C5]|nr:hypothetical protein [Candidatus Siliceabacter maunaloa]
MRQPLTTPTQMLPSDETDETTAGQARSDATAPAADRRGACWYALMRSRAQPGNSTGHAAGRPRSRAIHWSRTTARATDENPNTREAA